MDKLEISARMNVREGKLERFKQQASEIIRQTKEKDTKTLSYDWFLNADQTECEVREVYANSEGFIEHRMHVGAEIKEMFAEFAYDHAVTIYGDPSPQLLAMTNALENVDIKRYSFLRGLE
ncbi:MAG: putative quinol monooxygenase [Chloroflexia bacterium]